MTAAALKDPRRYFEAVQTRETEAAAPPVCLYLEVTNRCNLLCETCPRTFETLEPPEAAFVQSSVRMVVDERYPIEVQHVGSIRGADAAPSRQP